MSEKESRFEKWVEKNYPSVYSEWLSRHSKTIDLWDYIVRGGDDILQAWYRYRMEELENK